MGFFYFDPRHFGHAKTFDEFRVVTWPHYFVLMITYVRNSMGIQISLLLRYALFRTGDNLREE